MSALSLFDPLIARWFTDRFGRPTDIQERAWPLIAQGRNVLVTAPTGGGKTLAAFFWALQQLVTGSWPAGRTRVLYISPLKALNNDVQRNLLDPLKGLGEAFNAEGRSFPDIRVRTRSGDTPADERRRMLRRPPEILITTPESLNLILSSAGGRSMLHGLQAVILDEIHAVFGRHRGVHLMTAVDRLVPMYGEFQRIALSATVRPIDIVADFVGGFCLKGPSAAPEYEPRPVDVVRSTEVKRYHLGIRYAPKPADEKSPDGPWKSLARECGALVEAGRSTLLFTNSRRLAEKITLFLNENRPAPFAWAHHGSLAREMRHEVEQKLKNGLLKAIVATSSLELGIDVGALDQVILIQSPPSISSAIQRVGRAGHRVGEVSRGVLFVTHPLDALAAAVLAKAVPDGDIEPTRPLDGPLDVLAQVIVSMVSAGPWNLDDLYHQIRTSHPYRNLGRRPFDLVVDMLAGRYREARIRELSPRLIVDREANTASLRKGALIDLYTSGGMIPNRGYYKLRHAETQGLIGELDEEFVWEARIGQTFTLGAQNWRIERVTHDDVYVIPGHPAASAPPFWRAEDQNRDFHLSSRMLDFLEQADGRVGESAFRKGLEGEGRMDAESAGMLVEFLKLQKKATNRPLPHRRRLLVEHVDQGPGGGPGHQVVLHTFWGGRVNRPWALALEAAWRDRFGSGPAFFPSDDSIAIVLPEPVDGRTILDLVTPDNLESLLRRRLEQSGFFCARFRESAGRALLLTRTKPGQRLPLWMNRLKSQRLLEAVQAYPDFPILLETWRTCLKDEFDLDALRMLLGELETGQIAWSEVHTPAPSPLAQGIAWRQINRFMYQFDEPPAGSGSRLADDLIREVALSPELRPAVPRHVIEAFEAKRRRLFPGYPPSSAADLVDWVRERWAIPQHEWDLLRTAMVRDLGPDAELVVTEAREKLVFVKEPPLVATRERLPMLNQTMWEEPGRLEGSEANGTDAEADLGWILGEWLSFYGPVPLEFVSRTLGLDPDRAARTAADLVDAETLVAGPLVDGEAGEWIADTRNFETLLRMSRSLSAPVVQPRPIEDLQAFLAGWQGLGADGEDAEALLDRMGRLMFLPLPAGLWETEVLPARLAGYRPAWLDEVLREGTLAWIGGPGRTIAFGSLDALDLWAGEEPGAAVEPVRGDPADDEDAKQGTDPSDRPEPDFLFPDPEARYDFGALARGSGLSGSELVKRLWAEVWQGRAANNTFLPIRRGLASGWKAADSEAANGPGGAARFGSRRGRLSLKSPSPLAGNWFRLPSARPPEDLIDAEERKKDRARLLLDRYGVAARELLAREAPGFRWPDLFRTFRLMELSGEVAAGLFFENLAGPQFTEPRTLGLLAGKFAEDRVWWLSALDPASLCGLGIEALRRRLPHRREGVRLVYRGRDLALVSERKGKALTIHLAPDDPGLIPCLEVVKFWFARPAGGPARVRVETINDLPAGQSPYLEPIRSVFTVMVEHKEVSLYPK